MILDKTKKEELTEAIRAQQLKRIQLQNTSVKKKNAPGVVDKAANVGKNLYKQLEKM